MHKCIKFISFWNDTLHVSGGLSVHRQEFKTLHTATGICQTDTAVCLLADCAYSNQTATAVCLLADCTYSNQTDSAVCLLADCAYSNQTDTAVCLLADCTYSNGHMSNRYCFLLASKQTAVSV